MVDLKNATLEEIEKEIAARKEDGHNKFLRQRVLDINDALAYCKITYCKIDDIKYLQYGRMNETGDRPRRCYFVILKE